jgi:hypothetical protein
MPFTTDGRVHTLGIANEKEVCSFLNERSTTIKAALCPPGSVVNHQGGTGTKADAVIVSAGGNKTISIKHHKTGTFDWLNSSAALPASLKETLQGALSGFRSAFTKAEVDEKRVRAQCEELFAEHLRTMSSETIRGILHNCYSIYTDYVIITDVAKKELVAFDRYKNMPELQTFEGWTYFLKSTPRAKTSAQIWRRNAEGQEINTKLRMRLVLNNGVSALLGLSASNKTSFPCIKIQQDDVSHFIRSLVEPVKETVTE